MKTLAFANGDRMPILGLGTWKSKPGEVYAAVREALRIGYRHIDCAAIYGNEAEIGQALKDAFTAAEVRRDELWITSKLWNNAHAREEVQPALRKTLRDLGLDYLDLYLIHWPVAFPAHVGFPSSGAQISSPAEAPLRDTWAGMEDAARAGLTRHVGVSNFSPKKIGDLLPSARIKPEVDQVELHPYLQQDALVSYCQREGIHVTAYSPLGSSDRPANMKAAAEPSLLSDATIRAIAEERGATPAQVLIAWHIARGVSVIPKSVSPERLRQNFAAAELELRPADMERIAALERGFRYVDGTLWAQPDSPWTLETLWDGP